MQFGFLLVVFDKYYFLFNKFFLIPSSILWGSIKELGIVLFSQRVHNLVEDWVCIQKSGWKIQKDKIAIGRW